MVRDGGGVWSQAEGRDQKKASCRRTTSCDASCVSCPRSRSRGVGRPRRRTKPRVGLQLDAIDRSADACTDFFQYACGAWMAKNPVPADRSSWGRFDELQERNNETLRKILEAAAAGRDPAARKIGDYYASCMDETAINAKGRADSIR